jgi:O-antigen/teichoic acid export membrane protein
LSWSMGAFIFQNLGNIIAKIFYITGKTQLISLIAILELIIYLICGFILSSYLSFIGLSIALSVSSMVSIFLFLFFINKNIFKIDFYLLFNGLLKIVLTTVFSFFLVYLCFHLCKIGLNEVVYLILCLGVGSLLYIVIGYALRIEELVYLNAKVKQILVNRNIIRNKSLSDKDHPK